MEGLKFHGNFHGWHTVSPETPKVGWLVCWSLTSLCHSNGHIETMPAREFNPFTALTRIRSQFLRTQGSTSNHQRVDMTTPHTAQPSGLARDAEGVSGGTYGGGQFLPLRRGVGVLKYEGLFLS